MQLYVEIKHFYRPIIAPGPEVIGEKLSEGTIIGQYSYIINHIAVCFLLLPPMYVLLRVDTNTVALKENVAYGPALWGQQSEEYDYPIRQQPQGYHLYSSVPKSS